MGIKFMTGFEMGSIALPGITQAYCQIEASTVHTGGYALQLYNSANPNYPSYVIPVTIAGAEIYWAFWYNGGTFQSVSDDVHFGIRYEDSANYVRVECPGDASNVIRFVRKGTTLVTSGANAIKSGWQHIQIYVKAADSGGIAQCKIDGNLVLDYSGDTLANVQTNPSAVYFYGGARAGATVDRAYFDDIMVRDDAWPGDIRIDKMVPSADTAQKDFSRSAGSDNYALVDEVGPSDADYVYSSTNGHKDLYGLGDFTGTNRTIVAICTWARARKDTAGGQQLKINLKSDDTDSAGSAQDLTTSFAYYNRLDAADPDTASAWTDSGVDALQAGVEAVIP